ncbi:MAG TPA: Amuc_1100 family pilus-like protein [Candidatus Dormibacteraeota bacterium]|nr:Amuc_1100 family pilus-like protein [Candidatus Dormibacteraeota bacterium]
MSWIKRNLYFVVGGGIAVLLLGLAGWYLFSKWQLDNTTWNSLNQAYEDLKKLNQQPVHPGTPQVDNVKTAKEQQQELKAFSQKARKIFQPIRPIPDLPRIADPDFSAALSRTIDQLRKDCTNASVNLPADYNFSFQAEKNKLVFQPPLGPLAVQLGEVKAICDVLVQAKINSLDALQRERVSPDDAGGNQTDYLASTSITNDLGVLTPYALTIRCFTPELAQVLTGFASSPYGFIAKTINVEPASPMSEMTSTETTAAPPPATVYAPSPQVYAPQRPPPSVPDEARYRSERPLVRPAYTPPPVVYQPAPAATAPAKPAGLQVALDERLLKITLLVEVVKLAPSTPAK